MSRSVLEKMDIKEDGTSIAVNAPDNFLQTIEAAGLSFKKRLVGEFDHIHCFLITQEEMQKQFPKMKSHLKPGGKLWISWPKSERKQTDLSLTTIIKIGYDFGLVESKVISIDDDWSAIKFTFPKKGKEYKNSYGKLKK